MSADRHPVVEVLINDGRQHYGSNRYKQALECFTRAMKRCSCTRNMRRERCACKNYERVIAMSGSIFHEAMYNCTCDVGKTFNKCDNELHIKALDYRAATFEAMQELDRARKDAEWMLELAPRFPDGYLRLGKIVCLQKKYEFAWKVYSAGIEANGVSIAKKLPKVKALYAARQPLHKRFFRQDPFQLPLDLMQAIFDLIDFRSLVRCLRVSKSWARSLTSHENSHMWRSLHFSTTRRPVSKFSLWKMIRYSGDDIRLFIVENSEKFQLTPAKFEAVMRGAPKLKVLQLRGRNEAFMSPSTFKLSNLTDIVLDRCQIPTRLLESVAENIQDLDIQRRIRQVDAYWQFPVMPKLRYFRLLEVEEATSNIILPQLMRQLPNLQQLTIDAVHINSNVRHRNVDEVYKTWTQLKVLIIAGSGINIDRVMALSQLVSIGQGNGLQHLDVRAQNTHQDPPGASILGQPLSLNDWVGFFSSSNRGSGTPNTYANLRSLSLGDFVLDPVASEEMFRIPIADGKLHTFDIEFPRPELRAAGPQGAESCIYISQFQWLRGSKSIRSLGIFNFDFQRHPRDDDELPLPSFVASFPNLETLEITSEYYEEIDLYFLIIEIIKKTTLKKIYQKSITGANLDRLKVVARSSGVELTWGQRPRKWPVPIED